MPPINKFHVNRGALKRMPRRGGTAKLSAKMRMAREALERMGPPKMDAARDSVKRPNSKMLAAREARLRLYADIQRQRIGRNFTPKMAAAAIALARAYESMRGRLRETELYEPLACDSKVDRFIATTEKLSPKAILGIPGFKASNPRRLWKRDYRFAQRIKGTGSISQIVVESGPTAAWFAPFRIAVIPRDETGLRFQDLCSLLEVLPSVKIIVLEVALDFSNRSVVDLDYVRRFGLFGSTWLQPGSNPYHDKWGHVGSKIVRAYVKWGTSQFRVELELHIKFLRENGIQDVFDFRQLLFVLFPDHIHFVRLDEAKLDRALHRSGLGLDERRAVRARVQQKAQRCLWEALRYLREKAHLTNVQRLLVPVPEMNRVIRESLQRLVSRWPVRPTRLERKP